MEFSDKFAVKVRADFSPSGEITPIKLKRIDESGNEAVATIDRVVDICPGASMKIGVSGYRYTVMIGGRQFHLYFSSNRWYLEAP